MFATPDWDDDNPKTNVKFAKKIKLKKNKNVSELPVENSELKEHNIQTNQFSKKKKTSKLQITSVFQIPETNSSPSQKKTKGKNKVKQIITEKENKFIQIQEKIKNKKIEKESVPKELNKELNGKLKTENKVKKPKLLPQESPSKSEISVENGTNSTKDTSSETISKKKKKKPKKVSETSQKETHNKSTSKTLKRKLEKANDNQIEFNTDNPDKLLLNIKKKKLNNSQNVENSVNLQLKKQKMPSQESENPESTFVKTKLTKAEKRKELFKKVLKTNETSHRNPIKSKGAVLRQKMIEKLKSAQFRFLNEKLYTSTGTEAQQIFQEDPAAFQAYHEGYQRQIQKWPVNPLDVIIKRISKLPKSALIADMGCGEAKLAQRLTGRSVRSFDLVSTSPLVEACDMARTPLLTGSVDVAVYCLALMGTALVQYLAEANRVLKTGGLLLIAEVESRFDDADAFAKEVEKLGFKLQKLDKSQNVFFFMEFKKVQECGKKQRANLNLKPCYYKKR